MGAQTGDCDIVTRADAGRAQRHGAIARGSAAAHINAAARQIDAAPAVDTGRRHAIGTARTNHHATAIAGGRSSLGEQLCVIGQCNYASVTTARRL